MFNLSKGLVPWLLLPNLFTTEFVKLPPEFDVAPKLFCIVLRLASFDNTAFVRLDNCILPDKYLDPATAAINKLPAVPRLGTVCNADFRFTEDNKS